MLEARLGAVQQGNAQLAVGINKLGLQQQILLTLMKELIILLKGNNDANIESDSRNVAGPEVQSQNAGTDEGSG